MNAINRQLKDKFERYEDIFYNPNTKESDYQNIILSPLKEYLGSKFEFYNRAQLIDAKMDSLKVFSADDNEFDIVATFRRALPKIDVKIENIILRI